MSVVHYNTNFKIAQKPYITEIQKAINITKDTSWNILINNNKAKFHSKKTGIYIIRADSSKIRGMLKVKFKGTYPLISKSNDMLEVLEYILTESEFQSIKNSNNKKLNIDNFWIKTCNNKEKARELIKIWYNRATYSNYYFTSYKKGIKTDRGMIYTVFGPPDDIKYFDDAEKWIYINTKNISKLEFIFVKQPNSISNNDYVLIRKSKYEAIWNKAIKTWRNGKVFKY
jgi:GWxTD domain-containing protein